MATMSSNNTPKYIKNIEKNVIEKLKHVKKPTCELMESKQEYFDQVLEIFRDAFKSLIENTRTYSLLLSDIKNAYENAMLVRDERISQYIIQDKVFGISVWRKQRDDKIKYLLDDNEHLKEENQKLTFEITRLKKDLDKLKDDKFTEYLALMRERDARYTLYFENVDLHLKLRELDGGQDSCDGVRADPAVLRIALDRTREQLSSTLNELKKMKDDYADTVPRREHDLLEAKQLERRKQLEALQVELDALQAALKRLGTQKKGLEEELIECKERCSELERAGTPRPHWETCADFIGGGRDRWWQLTSGLSSRDMLRVLLKELGPAADSDHLEYFDGLGTDPAIPPYLRYEGRVRNLRLSRRELSVLITDIWLGRRAAPRDVPMQDYVTKYFEDRYQQPSVRAEWAYNLCAGAEQLLDEQQVRLFWGVLHGQLSEDIYWGLRALWQRLRDHLYRQSKDGETITMEEFEKGARATFPLKSEVDIKNLSDVVKKQLKMKINQNEVNLDKLFFENEEGFDRVELACELFRQRQRAQDKYLREVVGALGRRARAVAPAQLQRAFAIVDPAIDHVRMERYIRWAFSDQTSELSGICPLPLRAVAARLAAGDIERVGPRHRATRKH